MFIKAKGSKQLIADQQMRRLPMVYMNAMAVIVSDPTSRYIGSNDRYHRFISDVSISMFCANSSDGLRPMV